MRRINAAWDVLGDEEQRAAYDRQHQEEIRDQIGQWQRRFEQEEHTPAGELGKQTGERLARWLYSDEGKKQAVRDFKLLMDSVRGSMGLNGMFAEDRDIAYYAEMLRNWIMNPGGGGGMNWGELWQKTQKEIAKRVDKKTKKGKTDEQVVGEFARNICEVELARRFDVPIWRGLSPGDVDSITRVTGGADIVGNSGSGRFSDGFRAGWDKVYEEWEKGKKKK
jgi:curved DNA-binding protein CbpA